ncbi:FecR family protein [Parapedobacter deserti]|uniref:FecR family protein n=1 Tax=Parapedobacter deserti TaxID=1912957 RepID=A0ABV7JJH2_9SPHI
MQDWDALYTRFLNRQCSADEIRQLLEHFEREGDRSELAERIRSELANSELSVTDSPEVEAAYNRIFQQLKVEIGAVPAPRQGLHRKLRWLPYAAAVLVAACGIWLLTRQEAHHVPQPLDATTIKPDGNRATLTLADGRVVDLDPGQAGITVGDYLRYDDGSELDAVPADQQGASAEVYATLTTPKGGTYRITFADSTIVWLNAASTLTYPLAFDGAERVVELTGEAYFDVQSQRTPFIVKSKNQSIAVLGTQFNVSAYPDDNQTQTTLVRGRVQVSTVGNAASLQLHSGEQSSLTGTTLTKATVDVLPFVAWKEGLFSFNGTELKVVMNQLSRWYDIEVVFEGDIPTTHYFGDINRQDPLSNVLDLLETSGLHFRVERTDNVDRLVVMP